MLIGEILRLGPAQAPSGSSQPLSSSSIASSSSLTSAMFVSPTSSSQIHLQPATQHDAASAGPSVPRSPQRDAVRAVLDRVLGAMNRFRDASPLMGTIHDGLVSLQGAM